MMSSIPTPIFVVVIITWVFCGLLFVAAIVGTILHFANRPGTGPRRVGGAIGMVCGSVLASLMVLGAVVGLSVTGFRATAEHHASSRAGNVIQSPSPQSAPRPVNSDAGLTRLPESKSATPADALKPLPEKVAP